MMNSKFGLVLIGIAVLGNAAAQCQTDIAASLYGAFSPSTISGNGTVQSPSNAAGALLELRHIRNPLVGYEATYSYNRANQSYSYFFNSPCLVCSYRDSASVPANAHEIAGDWLVSFKAGKLRPFALAGGGLLLNVPSASSVTVTTQSEAGGGSSSVTTGTSAKAVFVYGAGLDWEVLPHLGLRLQYRGNLYSASDLTKAFNSSNAFTHTSEPMVGVFFRL